MAVIPQGDRIEGLGTAGNPVGQVVSVQGTGAGGAELVDTELPAAAALSDTTANPTAPMVGAGVMVWGGATWHRWADMVADAQAVPGVGLLGVDRVTGATTRLRNDILAGLLIQPTPADRLAQGISGANATQTITLAAAGAGLFHYITAIRIARIATAAVVGGAVLSYTTTNISGVAWDTGNAIAAGQLIIDHDHEYDHPLKVNAANTATTIICPAAGAAVITNVTVWYYAST